MKPNRDEKSLKQYQSRAPERGDKIRYQTIATFCEGTILDVGCGTGDLSKYLNPEMVMGYVGLDTDGIVDIHGSIYHLPFKDRSFDTVVISEVLEHLEQPANALRELARVSKKRIVITVPNPWNLKQILSLVFHNHNIREPNHISLFGDNEIERLCERAGLSVEKIERFFVSLPHISYYIPIRSRFGEWNCYLCTKKSQYLFQ